MVRSVLALHFLFQVLTLTRIYSTMSIMPGKKVTIKVKIDAPP